MIIQTTGDENIVKEEIEAKTIIALGDSITA
jgi:hypothetical protein